MLSFFASAVCHNCKQLRCFLKLASVIHNAFETLWTLLLVIYVLSIIAHSKQPLFSKVLYTPYSGNVTLKSGLSMCWS